MASLHKYLEHLPDVRSAARHWSSKMNHIWSTPSPPGCQGSQNSRPVNTAHRNPAARGQGGLISLGQGQAGPKRAPPGVGPGAAVASVPADTGKLTSLGHGVICAGGEGSAQG